MDAFDCSECKLRIVTVEGEIKLLAQKQKAFEDNQKEFKTSISSLNKTISELNETLSEDNGKKDGILSTLKVIWWVFGSLIVAGIIGFATIISQLRTDVEVLKYQEGSKYEHRPN